MQHEGEIVRATADPQVPAAEALARTKAAYAATGDAALAREIMQQRMRAFTPSSPATGWPGNHAQLFPVGDNPPEVNADAFGAHTLASALQHNGALIVRGLTGAPDVAKFRDLIDKAMAALQMSAAGQAARETAPWYDPFDAGPNHPIAYGRAFAESVNAVLAADSPAAFEELADLYERTGVLRVIAEYLGEAPVLSVGKTALRRSPPIPQADWHQDSAFLGKDARSVNVWIALTDCGVDAPGMDMIPRRLPPLTTGEGGAKFDWSVGEGSLENVLASHPISTPRFKAGDAILFDGFFLHRTSIGPQYVRTRYALEAWFFAPSTFPMDYIPLVV